MAGNLIRSAKAGDVEFLAWAILTATRSHLPKGWFDIALGKPESWCLEFLMRLATARSASHWHYSRFLVAEDGSGPVATLSAFLATDAYPLATAAMTETMDELGLSPSESNSIWKRGAYMFRCTMRPDNDSWVIENLATLPEYRHRGYTSALLMHALERGHSRGIKQAQICLFIGNERAERAYKAVGFQFDTERRDAEFEFIAGAPGVRRYVRDL